MHYISSPSLGYLLYGRVPPVSPKRPFSTGLSFDWILLAHLLIVSRADYKCFVLFIEVVGVREYCCCMAVENGWQLRASCVLRRQGELRTRRTLVQAGR